MRDLLCEFEAQQRLARDFSTTLVQQVRQANRQFDTLTIGHEATGATNGFVEQMNRFVEQMTSAARELEPVVRELDERARSLLGDAPNLRLVWAQGAN
jgi:hypothetical protein